MKRDPTSFLKEEYEALVKEGREIKLYVVDRALGPWSTVNGKKMLMLSTNNYLNLANHPKVKEAAIKAIEKYGVGTGSVRIIAGNFDIHMEAEKRIARFKKTEASLMFMSGFTVNQGMIPILADKGDLIVSDELNHASIIDGVRLSKADRAIYKHRDMADLERVLNEAERQTPPPRRILIVTDGVFSMDGDIAPLKDIAKLAQEHGAMVYVDDAHGEGVLGNGRGIVEHFGLSHKEVHVDMGTFSKAIGVVGGHISGSEDLIRYAYNRARTWIFTASPLPAAAAAIMAALDVIENEPERVQRLWDNTRYYKKELESMGFDTGRTETPIVPIIIGENKPTREFAQRLMKEGIFVVPIFYPVVPRGTARIRTQMCSDFTKEDLNFALSTLEKIGKEMKII
ncbi:MAG: aminotransferase class I/II-fold pyridoxal phosphate-dependent enzyme [Candidatus Odinarchaeota archaeon]|nr:aminotransferase class I/II-fold pyridoxal phosphate-dependent enzyme [Candidatus Odinarchaeota archaeon]